MAERSLRQEGLPVDYYAPDYKIEIEGRTLDAETKGDVLDIKVTMEKKNLTGFHLTGAFTSSGTGPNQTRPQSVR